jgi:hypothetical protein
LYRSQYKLQRRRAGRSPLQPKRASFNLEPHGNEALKSGEPHVEHFEPSTQEEGSKMVLRLKCHASGTLLSAENPSSSMPHHLRSKLCNEEGRRLKVRYF